jgi:hypothetical protein
MYDPIFNLANPTSIDIVNSPRHKRSFIAKQKGNYPCHFNRLRPPLLRCMLETGFDVLWVFAFGQWCPDGTYIGTLQSAIRAKQPNCMSQVAEESNCSSIFTYLEIRN